MNPKLAWEEAQAKLSDFDREAAHRHMEGEAHRACQVCGLASSPDAHNCEHCSHPFKVDQPLWNWPAGP